MFVGFSVVNYRVFSESLGKSPVTLVLLYKLATMLYFLNFRSNLHPDYLDLMVVLKVRVVLVDTKKYVALADGVGGGEVFGHGY